jgi:hypothetical protein
MNEEYLWSKKGSDPEIQELEKLLSEYRFKHDDAPELPAVNVVTFAPEKKRRFSWIFAIASPVAAAIIAVFWFAIPQQGELSVRTVEPERQALRPVAQETQIAHHNVPDVVNIPYRETERVIENLPRTLNRRSRLPKSAAAVSQKIRLTREEKYAFDRLMLALSITGSKLKMVQDTVDGNSGKDLVRNTK